MITNIEDFFTKGCGRCDRFDTPDCSAMLWQEGVGELRRICRDMDLQEVVKWGHPCYMHNNRNIILIGALRGDFRLIFFNAALMKDPHSILERQGQNTRNPDMICFTDNNQVCEKEEIIRSYIEEAIDYADRGIKPPKIKKEEIELPEELVNALDADVELAEAFYKLTPGRQRSYVFNLNSAKKSETRDARIIKFRGKIIAGKGALER